MTGIMEEIFSSPLKLQGFQFFGEGAAILKGSGNFVSPEKWGP